MRGLSFKQVMLAQGPHGPGRCIHTRVTDMLSKSCLLLSGQFPVRALSVLLLTGQSLRDKRVDGEGRIFIHLIHQDKAFDRRCTHHLP